MPTYIRLILAHLLALLALPVHAETTAFVNVNVVPMSTETVLRAQTVVIDDGIIASIGAVDAIAVPQNAFIVDGTDRYLLPGLAEMHAHVTGNAEFERLATLFVANGVTSIRGMLGRATHLQLRDKLADGEVFGPRLITSGPSFNGRSVNGASNAIAMVREQQRAGYDFAKIHPGLDADEFAAVAMTANEIGMPYAGHVPVAAGVATALRLKMATIDHLDGYFVALLPEKSSRSGGFGGFFDVMLADQIDARGIETIAKQTAAAGTWNVPTQTLIEQLINDTPVSQLKNRAEMRYVPKARVQDWVDRKQQQHSGRDFKPEIAARAIELRRQLILALHKAGAGLLLGSDAPQVFNVPGFSLHRELELLVTAGLSPYEALRTGTVNVAQFLSSNGGVLATGKDADMLLLDANPLTDIRNSNRIHGVMLRGHWYPAVDLSKRLERYVVEDGS